MQIGCGAAWTNWHDVLDRLKAFGGFLEHEEAFALSELNQAQGGPYLSCFFVFGLRVYDCRTRPLGRLRLPKGSTCRLRCHFSHPEMK